MALIDAWLLKSGITPVTSYLKSFAKQRYYASINSGINRGLRESLRASRSQSDRQTRNRLQPATASDDHEIHQEFSERKDLATSNWTSTSTLRKSALARHTSATHGERQLFSVPFTKADSHFIFGERNVLSVLRAGRRDVRALYISNGIEVDNQHSETHHQVGRLNSERKTRGQPPIPIHKKDKQFLRKLASAADAASDRDIVHDGFAIECSPFPVIRISNLGSCAADPAFNVTRRTNGSENERERLEKIAFSKQRKWPFLVWLAGVTNVGNAGGIARTAAYYGADGIILNDTGSIELNSVFFRSSAGAAEYLPIFKAGHPELFIKHSRRVANWKFISAAIRGEPSRHHLLDDLKRSPLLDGPCVLCLGDEVHGVPEAILRKSDYTINIRHRSDMAKHAKLDSLNVGVAAGILMHKLLDTSN